MNNYLVLLLAATVLLLLIFNIKTSRRFNLFDHWLHHQLVKKRSGYKWQVIAFINDPKLMVVWDVLLYFRHHFKEIDPAQASYSPLRHGRRLQLP